MDITWFDIIALSITEGVTEFLPVSSTGHMIIVRDLLGLENTVQLSAFLVIVQAGSILAVLTAFRKTFQQWLAAWIHPRSVSNAKELRNQSIFVALSVVPFALVGFALRHVIKSLFNHNVVAYALITGGVLILLAEYLLRKKQNTERNVDSFTLRDALIVGLGQCCALWPGFSRSAATILAGRSIGFSRSSAAEISFLVGMPTLLGTAGYEALKEWSVLDGSWHAYLIVGILISWIVAYVCVKGFVAFLQKFSLSTFAYYRIVVGVLLLIYFKDVN